MSNQPPRPQAIGARGTPHLPFGFAAKPSPSAPPAVEPALGRPRVLNEDSMDKVHPMLASSFNEWGKTVAWPASRTRMARAATEVPIFIEALWAGLIPPFSAAENLFDGTIGVAASNGAKEEKRAEWEEMGNGGSAPLPIYSKRRPTGVSHDCR